MLKENRIRAIIMLAVLIIAALVTIKLMWSILVGLLKIAIALGIIGVMVYFAYIFIKNLNNSKRNLR